MAPEDDLGSAATALGATGPLQPTTPPGDGPSVIGERYEILGLLGAGGMGRVYRAYDRSLEETVALKLLRRELVDHGGIERFRQEVKLARRVTSTHVVRTFDLGQHGDEYFLTMEYIDGRSLAQLLDDGPVPVDEVVRIARGVAAGIAAAHATGVLHRDLKPDNVLVARTGRIVITDFGIAHASTSPIRTGEELVGTPAYMAPEQLESGAEIGPRADIYAFGAILFELLTGRRPFVGEGFQVALARLHQAPPDPRSLRPVPDALAELALRCLARAPADRFADGESLAAALAALQHLDVVKRPAPRAAAVPAKTSRSVAILPLRASGELAEIAEGLSEEIVDALSMSRSLRVRPLVSVRKLAATEPDSREVGKALGVEVVVDGSIRRRGEAVRIAARAIGGGAGLQLWASHFDTGPEGLLAPGDEVGRAR
ncbi:MAG: protein kinase, partial [Myxococcales bacterium]|nr:protein kinase [Myxococcales bacterium]